MTNRSLTEVVRAKRHGSSRLIMYLGGGTIAWATEFSAMMGRFISPSRLPIDRPCLECTRLCSDNLTRSPGDSAPRLTAASVWELIVSGFG